MSNPTKKNTERVARNIKPLLSVDWTKPEGETPFFVPISGSVPAYYAVAVDTGVSKYSEYDHFIASSATAKGAQKIFDFYGKDPAQIFSFPPGTFTIPGHGLGAEQEALGLYIPIRPGSNIKVLVTVPEILPATTFSELPDKPFVVPPVYDEIQLNSYGLEKKVNKAARLLESYDKSMIDFEGRVYNADLKKEAERMREIIPILRDLVRTNGYFYSDAQSDLIMLGMSGSGFTGSIYLPQYAQLNQGGGFVNLTTGFGQFTGSMFVTSNTMYLYKHLDKIDKIAMRRPTVHNDTGSAPMGWEQFINTYIKFPPPIVEYTSGRMRSPEPKAQMEKEIKDVNAKSTKDAKTLNEESWRLKSREFKAEMEVYRKEAKDFVGDTVLGNLNKTINTLNTIEDVYNHYLNKLGITYIVKSAVECLNLDLPIEMLKSFLLDVNRFAGEVLEILKIPVISLDDMIPTVDIMGDLVKQILLSIAEAVKKALIDMVKQVLMMYLEACGDPCKMNFGGMNIGEMLSKGKSTEALMGVVGTMGQNTGGAILSGMKAGVVSPGLSDQTRKFMSNLQRHATSEQIDGLTAAVASPLGQTQQAAGQALQQGMSSATEAIKSTPIGSFLDTLGSTLTCGEVNKMLKGKTTKDTVKIIQSTVNQLCDDPNVGDVYKPLCELLNDEDKINDFFGSLGKVVDEKPIQEQIDNFEDITPILATSLCDEDDTFLRCQLLKGKGIESQEVCDAQIGASRERAKKRINELSALLDKENPLEDVVPPVYCTVDKDGNIIEGLIERDHPSYMFMMDRVLDTTFDGIYNAFIDEASKFSDLLSVSKQVQDTYQPRVIAGDSSRGIGADIGVQETKDGSTVNPGWLQINPKLKMLLDQGYQVPNPVSTPFWEQVAQPDPGAWFGGWIDNDDPMDAMRNTLMYNFAHNDEGITPTVTKQVFLPGMSDTDSEGNNNGVYSHFQTSLRAASIDFDENLVARNLLNTRPQTMQFTIENQLASDLQSVGGQIPNQPAGRNLKQVFIDSINAAGQDPNTSQFQSILTDVFGVDNYAILYSQFATSSEADKNSFGVSIKADTNQIWNKVFKTTIPPSASQVISNRHLEEADLTPETSPGASLVERQFAELISQNWNHGEDIYVIQADGTVAPLLDISDRPIYLTAKGHFSRNDLDPNTLLIEQGINGANENKRLIGSLYNELLRDLQAKCLSQVKNSPLLDSNVFRLLNLTPRLCPGGSDNTLLELENIKAILKDVYKDIQCTSPTLPNVSGLGNNRDNALEQAMLYGLFKQPREFMPLKQF